MCCCREIDREDTASVRGGGGVARNNGDSLFLLFACTHADTKNTDTHTHTHIDSYTHTHTCTLAFTISLYHPLYLFETVTMVPFFQISISLFSCWFFVCVCAWFSRRVHVCMYVYIYVCVFVRARAPMQVPGRRWTSHACGVHAHTHQKAVVLLLLMMVVLCCGILVTHVSGTEGEHIRTRACHIGHECRYQSRLLVRRGVVTGETEEVGRHAHRELGEGFSAVFDVVPVSEVRRLLETGRLLVVEPRLPFCVYVFLFHTRVHVKKIVVLVRCSLWSTFCTR